MVDREEDQLVRYFDGIRLAEKQVLDEKMDAAIRRGIEQGQTLRSRWRVHRGWTWISGTAGVIAVCMLMFFIWQGGIPLGGSISTNASSTEVIPSYVDGLMTSEMERAAEHGLYQPIGKSAEVKGTKVTVDGVLADGRTVVVFYSMVNSKDPKAVDGYFAHMVDDEQRFSGTIYDPGTSFVDSENVTHTFFRITFPKGNAPTRMTFGINSGVMRDQLVVKFPIEWSSRPYEGLEKIIPVKQTATVDRTKIAIREMVLRPLSTTIVFEPEMRTNVYMAVNLKAKLYLGEKQENQFHYYTSSRSSFYDRESLANNEVILQGIDFESLYYSDWNEVTLQIDGFRVTKTSTRSFDLVIDTEKNEILTTDPSIQKVLVAPDQQSTQVSIYALKKQENKVKHPFEIKEEFTDHEGNKHRFLQKEKEVSPFYYSSDLTEVIRFKLEPKTYAQPLTFTLTETTESTFKPHEFKIKLK